MTTKERKKLIKKASSEKSNVKATSAPSVKIKGGHSIESMMDFGKQLHGQRVRNTSEV